MRIKSKLSIVAVFSCCAVMSIGFANWVIMQHGSIYETLVGGVEAERAHFSNEYLYIEDEGRDISPLHYTPEGFAVLKDDEVSETSYTGTMSVTFTADLDKCAQLSGGDPLEITVTLRLTGTNFSPLAAIQGVSSEDRTLVSNVGGELAEEKDVYTAHLTLAPAAGSGKATFTLVYTFVSNERDYLHDIYEVFYDSEKGEARGAEFSFGVSIRS